MSKVLFAVIGDPASYKRVKYKINECSDESKTSFSILKKCLNIDKTAIIAGISLAKTDECSDYDSCASYVKNYVKEKGIIADDIIVSPNIYGKFKGKPDSFYTYNYLHAIKIFEEIKPNEVILDTSHGINYMPLIMKDSLILAISAYSSKNKKEINFTMYNSDPPTTPEETYTIHQINQIKITPLSGLKYITSNILNKDKNRFNWKRIANDQKINIENFSDFLFKITKALNNGIFLYIIETKKINYSNITTKLENVIKTIKLETTNNQINIKNEAVIETAEAHALFYLASEFENKTELNLDDLKSYAETYLDEVTKTIIKNEINKIEQNKQKIETGHKKLLKEIIDQETKGINKRILYAHGGLPAAATYVELKNNKIYITYGDKINKIEQNI